MANFRKSERKNQADFKYDSPYFSNLARADGVYRKYERPYCVPTEFADQNLYVEIRQDALDYFSDERIKWHDGKDGMPSNHLCDSQVCCVNFIFPFADKPDALAELLRPLYPTIRELLPMEREGQVVSFEWIGIEDYLGELRGRHGRRTRGANFTSADGAVMIQHQDGVKEIVLIDWKYTESNRSGSLKESRRGTDRTILYSPIYESEDCPLDTTKISDFADLFYDPFDQLMRQQFLAHKMEKAGELGIERVSLLHIAPSQNTECQKVKSPAFKKSGESAAGVWNQLVIEDTAFLSISVEDLFVNFPVTNFPALKEWWDYIVQRYRWFGT